MGREKDLSSLLASSSIMLNDGGCHNLWINLFGEFNQNCSNDTQSTITSSQYLKHKRNLISYSIVEIFDDHSIFCLFLIWMEIIRIANSFAHKIEYKWTKPITTNGETWHKSSLVWEISPSTHNWKHVEKTSRDSNYQTIYDNEAINVFHEWYN